MCADLPADPSLPYAEVGAVLEAAGRIGLTCHVNPDPDALGSLLAMHHGLAQLGCSVVSSFPRPFRLSPGLAWLPGTAELVPPDDFPERVDVLMTFDAADLDRLHEFRHHADLAGTVVVEYIFGLPGLGSLALESALKRDYAVLQGVVLLIVIMFVVTTFVVDVVNGLVDPRVRVGADRA